MQISTDSDGTVYVRWQDGGTFLVLRPEGDVTTGYMGGMTNWFEYPPGKTTWVDYATKAAAS